MYSGTPPYDHPVYKTTSLLRPCSFKANIKNIDSFSYFEDPVNATTSLLRPGFYGLTVVALTGFHCSYCISSITLVLLFFFLQSVKGVNRNQWGRYPPHQVLLFVFFVSNIYC